MAALKVLVVGSGGREHAIVNALARSPQRPQLLCAPGNPGIAEVAECIPEVKADDLVGLVDLAKSQAVDLVVVGPEVPLVEGVADLLLEVGIPCFGPSAAAAKLEGSKAFAKEIMQLANVPTAKATVVETVADGLAAVDNYPVVFKADGLAAGKGVLIVESEQDAQSALESILLEQRFGKTTVLVEEFLDGHELSLLALCDGKRAIPLAPAQDFKRIFDHDLGPNTGGMGAYSPVPGFDSKEIEQIVKAVHQPVVDLMAARGTPFHGVLYAGLMFTDSGVKVLEFNTRFGDPETQAVLPRLQSDLLELMLKATKFDGLADVSLSWSSDATVTVVLASSGYPESSSSGDPISGLESVDANTVVTHAGTAYENGSVVTAGGRVLNVTGCGKDIDAARKRAYNDAARIEFAGKQLRTDIALRASHLT